MASGPYQPGMPLPDDMEKLIRPEHISKAAFLNDQTKQKYSNGILQLWNKALQAPPNSQERIVACQKLAEVTQQLGHMHQTHKAQLEQQRQKQGQQAQQGQPAQPAQQAQQQQPQAPSNQGQNTQVASQPQPQAAAQPARPQTQEQQGAQKPAQPAQQWTALREESQKHLENLAPPAGLASDPEQAQRWIQKTKHDAAQAINTHLQTQEGMAQYQAAVTKRNKASPLTDPEKNGVRQKMAEYHQRMKHLSDQLMNFNANAAKNRANANANGTPAKEGAAQPKQEPAIPNKGPQIKSESGEPAAAIVPAVASPAPPNQASQPSSRPATVTAGQAMPPQVNLPVKQEASRTAPQAGQNNSAPYALSHKDAVDMARNSYTQPAPSQTPTSTVQQSSHSHANMGRSDSQPRTDQKSAPPTQRPLQVQPLQPVTMPAARPTMTGGAGAQAGMMGQPALQKHHGYVLEGEGERVLSEKKLEELVRQVTGSSGGEGSDTLDSDVKETLLDLADEFVDNVIMAACRVAKLRNSSTLELRDLQLILERNYNIRVPGYASDELRTVKKIQPTQSWAQKMSAVQAAKVTGGKADI